MHLRNRCMMNTPSGKALGVSSEIGSSVRLSSLKSRLALGAALVIGSAALPADAAEQTWIIRNATFVGGGALTGSIIWDPLGSARPTGISLHTPTTTYSLSVGFASTPDSMPFGSVGGGMKTLFLSTDISGVTASSRRVTIKPGMTVMAGGLPFYSQSYEYLSGTVTLLLTGGYFELLGGASGGNYTALGLAKGGGTAPAMGATLDAVAAGGSTDFTSVFAMLDALSAADQQTAIKQTGPSQLVPQMVSINTTLSRTARVIEHRAESAGRGEASGLSAGSEMKTGTGLWGEFLGGVASRAGTGGTDGYNSRFYGMVFGADRQLTDSTLAGLAFSWVRTDIGGTGDSSGTKASADNYLLSAYGGWRSGPVFVNGQVGFGGSAYDQSRSISWAGTTAKAGYGGLTVVGKLNGGYDFTVGPAVVSPIGGIMASRTMNRAYSETGAEPLNLSVGRQAFNSVETSLGVKVATSFATSAGTVKPDLSASWLRDLTRSKLRTSGALGGVGFTTEAERPAADGLGLKAGLDLVHNATISFRGEYDSEIRRNYTSHAGLLKLRYKL